MNGLQSKVFQLVLNLYVESFMKGVDLITGQHGFETHQTTFISSNYAPKVSFITLPTKNTLYYICSYCYLVIFCCNFNTWNGSFGSVERELSWKRKDSTSSNFFLYMNRDKQYRAK